MKPVTVVLLATLLPTLLVILFLACLSVYLRVKLRATRILCEKIKMQLKTAAEIQPESPVGPPPVSFPPWFILSTDASKPDWKHDFSYIFAKLHLKVTESANFLPPSESEVKENLEAIGYSLAPASVIYKLLSKNSTRYYVAKHLVAAFALQQTDLENPLSSTVPFSPELRMEILKGFKALQGMTYGTEFHNILSKLPSQIVAEYGTIYEQNPKKSLEGLLNLLGRFAHPDHCGGNGDIWEFLDYPKVITDLLTMRLRMLVSRQQFKFEWREISDKVLCAEPDIRSYSGEDGVPLDQPMLWYEGDRIKISDDGEHILLESDTNRVLN